MRPLDRIDPRLSRSETDLKCFQKLVAMRRTVHLPGQPLLLFLAQRLPLGISQQAIKTPDDVAQMERHRRKVMRPGGQFFLTQRTAPAFDILSRQLQSMKHGSLLCVQFRESTA